MSLGLTKVMLCWQMNGQALSPAHGFPLRLIVPGWYGMASVKWLTDIQVVEGPWWGHQMEAEGFSSKRPWKQLFGARKPRFFHANGVGGEGGFERPTPSDGARRIRSGCP